MSEPTGIMPQPYNVTVTERDLRGAMRRARKANAHGLYTYLRTEHRRMRGTCAKHVSIRVDRDEHAIIRKG